MVCIYTAFFLYYTAPDKKEYMMLLLDTLLNQYLKATMAASLLMDRRVQINCASICFQCYFVITQGREKAIPLKEDPRKKLVG